MALPFLLAVLLAPLLLVAPSSAGAPTWADTMACSRWNYRENCQLIGGGIRRVSLNSRGGAGMQASKHYINGIFSLSMKLPAGNTTGVVYAWYLMDTLSKSNKDDNHSEIDVEIYGGGNATQAMLATNIFCNGKQNLVQYNLPFDPSRAFHTYTIKWNARQILWFVDNVPIRVLNRHTGQPWPMYAMKPMASIWLAPWVRNKIDPSKTPVTARYSNFSAQGCAVEAWETQKPRVQCSGPWNWGTTKVQMDVYQKARNKTLIVDYGWDDA